MFQKKLNFISAQSVFFICFYGKSWYVILGDANYQRRNSSHSKENNQFISKKFEIMVKI